MKKKSLLIGGIICILYFIYSGIFYQESQRAYYIFQEYALSIIISYFFFVFSTVIDKKRETSLIILKLFLLIYSVFFIVRVMDDYHVDRYTTGYYEYYNSINYYDHYDDDFIILLFILIPLHICIYSYILLKKRKIENKIINEKLVEEAINQIEIERILESTSKLIAQNDYNNIIFQLERAALLGSEKAMYELATFYSEGKWVRKDMSKAIEYYKGAANKNYPQALYELGMCYLNGKGIEKDFQIGQDMLKRAAKLGNKESLIFLTKIGIIQREKNSLFISIIMSLICGLLVFGTILAYCATIMSMDIWINAFKYKNITDFLIDSYPIHPSYIYSLGFSFVFIFLFFFIIGSIKMRSIRKGENRSMKIILFLLWTLFLIIGFICDFPIFTPITMYLLSFSLLLCMGVYNYFVKIFRRSVEI
jgi:TPR repeat, SEL1 subfamily protein